MKILVLGELLNDGLHPATLELALRATGLSPDVSILVGTPVPLTRRFSLPVHTIEHPDLMHAEAVRFAEVFTMAISRLVPDIVLVPATSFGRAVAPAVAARLDTGLTADCTGLDLDPATGLLHQIRPAFGGSIMATIITPHARPQMATVRPRPPAPGVFAGKVSFPAIPMNPPIIPTDLRVQVLSDTRFPRDRLADLSGARIVVAGGRGLRRGAGFELIKRLADAVGGQVGASRAAVEAGWIDHAHQVGLSGTTVSCDTYFAVGISGAVQHIAGMRTARTIIAINKDPFAPIMKLADIALVGDAWDILPRLIDHLGDNPP